jgi:hypothetical protein
MGCFRWCGVSLLWQRPWHALVVNGNVGEGRFRYLDVLALGSDTLSIDLHQYGNGGSAQAGDGREERQQIAYAHGLFEDELVYRHCRHAAFGVAGGNDGACQVDLCHHPAAENIAIGIAVRRHGDDLHDQFFVEGQGDGCA